MKTNKNLAGITGKTLKDWYEWLAAESCGCCHVVYESDDRYNYCVCVGWHDCGGNGWKIAWKIGRQKFNNCMQTDLDIDFEMPYNPETGDVDDTETVFEAKPTTMKEWNGIAAEMRKAARRVWKDWRDKANDEN